MNQKSRLPWILLAACCIAILLVAIPFLGNRHAHEPEPEGPSSTPASSAPVQSSSSAESSLQAEPSTTGESSSKEASSAPAESSSSAESLAQAEVPASALQESRLETVSYDITYEGTTYTKDAIVYLPAGYSPEERYDVLYLLHGSGGSADMMASSLKRLLDEGIAAGDFAPILVVFPTYYPDRTLVSANYSADYPLNHFFGQEEVRTLVRTVESRYATYASSVSDEDLQQSRLHRAFGGYSMGGVTTWEVLAYQVDIFGAFMPMAGDCWIDRAEDLSSDAEIATFLAEKAASSGITPGEIRIIAMVGGADGTKYSMMPQIEALRTEHSDVFNDENLLYWENADGGHNETSLRQETEHGLPLLFAGFSKP